MATIERPLPKSFPDKKGINKTLATFVLAGTVAAGGIGIWAATNQGEQNKPEPTPVGGVGVNPTPEITPSPTVTIKPTESPVITPTPEITPSPTPEPTSMPVSSIIEAEEHEKPSVKTVVSNIKTAVENNPASVDENRTLEKLLKRWEYCQNGDPMLGGDPDSNKEANCEILIVRFYQTYAEFKDENFYNLAKDVYDYAINTLPKAQVDGLNKNLEEVL